MKVMLRFNNQRGFVTPFSIGVMILLTILVSAVVPMVINDTKQSIKNRDMFEAQYAAEAGAKYAIAKILNNNTDWNWAQGTTPLTFITGSTEAYTITITKNSDSTLVPISGALVTSTVYKIKSVGSVNGSSRTVTVLVTTPSLIFSPALYAGNTLSTNGSPEVKIGDVYYSDVSVKGKFTVDAPYAEYDLDDLTNPPKVNTYDINDFKSSPYIDFAKNETLTDQKYFINSSVNKSGNGTVKITGPTTGTAFVYINGDFTFAGSYTITGNVVLIVKGNFNTNGNFTMSNGNSIVYCQNASIQGSQTVASIIAYNNISIGGSADITGTVYDLTGSAGTKPVFNQWNNI